MRPIKLRDKHQAAKAYDRAAKKYHGQFASLNFPGMNRRRRPERSRRIDAD